MEAFSHEEESAYLKAFLTDNELLVAYNGTLPLLKIPSYDVQVLQAIDHPSHIVVFHIIERLCQLGAARMFLYTFREPQEPASVLVWESDYNKMTKYIKDKLVRIRV
jgi:hypothetical protein